MTSGSHISFDQNEHLCAAIFTYKSLQKQAYTTHATTIFNVFGIYSKVFPKQKYFTINKMVVPGLFGKIFIQIEF